MKKLDEVVYSPKGFRGYTMKRVMVHDDYYLYEQHNNHTHTINFHVFESNHINTMFNTESYPGGECFGKWAWQFTNLNHAKNYLKKLVNLKIKT